MSSRACRLLPRAFTSDQSTLIFRYGYPPIIPTWRWPGTNTQSSRVSCTTDQVSGVITEVIASPKLTLVHKQLSARLSFQAKGSQSRAGEVEIMGINRPLDYSR